jgi:hypothetical protein
MGQRFAPPTDAVITVGADTSDVFPVAIQLKGQSGCDMQYASAVFCYLSKNSDGSTICVDETDTTEIVAGTDGLWVETLADLAGWAISESDGDIDLAVTVKSGKSAYLVVVLPNGRLVISSVMTGDGA